MEESNQPEEIVIELHELLISMGFYLYEQEAHLDDIDLEYLIALRDALDLEIIERSGEIH